MSETEYWERVRTEQISRRGVIRSASIFGAGLSAAALIGCSSSKSETPAAGGAPGSNTAPGVAPVARTGTLRMSVGKSSETFDPAIMVSSGPTQWGLWSNTAIYRNKKDYKLEPSLVESWEIKSKDEIVLKVRKNVFFHDKAPTNGRVMNAADIAYSLNRHAGILDPQNAARYQRRPNFRGMTKAEAVDDSTVVLKMSLVNSQILDGVADMRAPILAVENSKDSDFVDPNKLSGTGPWVIKQIDENGAGTLTANPKYWEAGMPKAATVQRPYFENNAANLAGFISDSHDFVSLNNQPYTDFQTLAQKRPDAKQLLWDYGYIHYALFNCTKPPFTDERVRRAMQMVIDVKPIGDGYYGPLWSYTGPLASTWTSAIQAADIQKRPGWNPTTKEQDIAEGKKLMAAAGFPEGELNLALLVRNTPVHPANSERVRAQWTRVWPKMKITLEGPLDTGPFYVRQTAGKWDILTNSNLPGVTETLEFQNCYTSDGGKNYGFFKDDQVDKLTSQALAEVDPAARGNLLKQAQEIVVQKVPGVYFYCAKTVVFVSPKWTGYESWPGPGGLSGNDMIDGSKLVTLKA